MKPKPHHGPKNSARKSTRIVASNYHAWYADGKTVITLISILVTVVLGIITIVNSRYIARLGEEFYVPSLQYQIKQGSIGTVLIDVLNQGRATATNVTITLSWNYPLLLKECQLLPPYQDVEPVSPPIPNNVAYRVSSLPVRANLSVECKIFKKGILLHLDLETPSPSRSTSTPSIIFLNQTPTPIPLTSDTPSWAALIPTGMQAWQMPVDTENHIYADEIILSPEMLRIDVIADNAEPAVEVAGPSKVAAIVLFEETSVPAGLPFP